MTSTECDGMENIHNQNVEETVILDSSEIKEEIDFESDNAIDSGCESEGTIDESELIQELQLNDDSCAYSDLHNDSIFCIAQHPMNSNLVATGGSEGEDAGGIGYIYDISAENSAVLTPSYQNKSGEDIRRKRLKPIFKLEGHSDSISALTFTLPKGEALISGGLDGKLRAYTIKQHQGWNFFGESQEVEEISWLAACPNEKYPNVIALGASDGSVWVYSIDLESEDASLQIHDSFFIHTRSCTAGNWSSDGNLLATVSEDGSLYVWDVFGLFLASGIIQTERGKCIFGLTAQDQRFAVDGGLFSVAVAPNGNFLAAGGADGSIKIIGLPRIGSDSGQSLKNDESNDRSRKRLNGELKSNVSSIGQAGQILADLKAQTDGIETLAFSSPPMTLLASGSIDGSIVIFDPARQFAVRRLINEAHGHHCVVKVQFVSNPTIKGCLLTSCGMDGVLKRWDVRNDTKAGLIREWKGHKGNGEGGGILDFVQGNGSRIVTAGDDALLLVFD